MNDFEFGGEKWNKWQSHFDINKLQDPVPGIKPEIGTIAEEMRRTRMFLDTQQKISGFPLVIQRLIEKEKASELAMENADKAIYDYYAQKSQEAGSNRVYEVMDDNDQDYVNNLYNELADRKKESLDAYGELWRAIENIDGDGTFRKKYIQFLDEESAKNTILKPDKPSMN